MTAPAKWAGSGGDEPFFREWGQRASGDERSLERARQFAAAMDLAIAEARPLGVIGSKGKGTAASYAAATLHRAGRSVGLITSPGYRTNRERIRLDGMAISPHEYHRLSSRVAAALAALPPREPGCGYLSPTGVFVVAGITWLVEQGCDSLVVEAGKGGRSDELSLAQPSVVAVTAIFEEHIGILGDTLAEIAAEKAGVISAATQAVVSVPQQPAVRRIVEDRAADAGAQLAFVTTETVERINGSGRHATSQFRANAELGVGAALAYVDTLDKGDGTITSRSLDIEGVGEVSLPGRLSVHHRDDQTWVVDSAISADGVAAALAWCRQALGEPSTVLLSIPDESALAACLEVVDHRSVGLLRVDVSHLRFVSPGGHQLPTLAEVDRAALGDLVLAVGTLSFIGEVLDLLDVDMTRLF